MFQSITAEHLGQQLVLVYHLKLTLSTAFRFSVSLTPALSTTAQLVY